MRRAFHGISFTLAVFLAHPGSLAAAGERLSDPYEILDRHYEAIGGVERLLGENTAYYEAAVTSADLEGRTRHWFQRPGRHRTETDFGTRHNVSGDNGETAWSLDANGRVKIERDERALKLRDLNLRMQRFEHLDRRSEIFSHTFEGVESVDGAECYVVRTANSLDDAITLRYFDTSSFLERKATSVLGDRGWHTLYSDFREADGIVRAYHIESQSFPVENRSVTQIETYVMNLDVDESLFEPPQSTRDFEFVGGEDSAEIPFELIDDHIYIPVTVNCDKRLWILDSGAGSTLIDTDYARGLGLELTGSRQTLGAGQSVELAFVTLPPLRVPGVTFAEQKLAAIPISGLFRQASDVEIGGLLGYDFLSRFITRVDYAKGTLTLYDPDTFVYEGDGTVVQAALVGNVLSVAASLGGTDEGRWMLDVGADVICLTYPFAEKEGFVEREGIEVVGMGAGGALEAMISRFDRLEFAGHVFDNPIAFVPTSNVVGALGDASLDGVLGYDIFRELVLFLDYGRQEVIVERGAQYGTEQPLDRSGLLFWRSLDGEVEVFFVSPGTPAEEAGFQKGDIIEALNGIGTDALKSVTEMRRLFEAEAGTTYEIRILRGGEARVLEMTLRDLL